MADILIRPAQVADADQVGALWRKLLEEQAAHDGRFSVADDALARWHNDFRYWVRDEHRRLVVALADEDIVGFASAGLWTPPPIYAAPHEAHVDELFVAPAYRARGAGQALLAAVRSWAAEKRAARLRITTLFANQDAISFWEEMGARPFTVTLTLDLQDGAARVDEEPEKRRRLGF